MTERFSRSVIEPVNPRLNVSRNANLPHSPGIRVGDMIFLSGMGPVDPVTGGRNLGPIAEQIRQQAMREYYDPGRIQRQLEDVERLRSEGLIDEADAEALEDELLERLLAGRGLMEGGR